MIVHLLMTPLLQYQPFLKYTLSINMDYFSVNGELLDATEGPVIESKLMNSHFDQVHVV